jgi:flagellar protein FliO/FliZ
MWRYWLFNLLFFCTAPAVAEQAGKKVNPNPSVVSESIGAGNYIQVFLGLLVVVVAIVAMAWMIKRIGYIQTRTHGALRIVGGVPVSQRERILLLQVGKEQIVIGVAPGHISTLHVLKEPIDVDAPAQTVQGSFYERLQSVLKGERP